jgi:hypothetical protein
MQEIGLMILLMMLNLFQLNGMMRLMNQLMLIEMYLLSKELLMLNILRIEKNGYFLLNVKLIFKIEACEYLIEKNMKQNNSFFVYKAGLLYPAFLFRLKSII